MNLHAVVAGNIAAVNPLVPVSVSVSRGYSELATGFRLPLWTLYTDIPAQIQAMPTRELAQIEGLNQGGDNRFIYFFGVYNAVLRSLIKGGDLVKFPDGTCWKTVMKAEQWPDWCKVAVTGQNLSDKGAIGAFVIGEGTIGGTIGV